jgi:hypothetical protein
MSAHTLGVTLGEAIIYSKVAAFLAYEGALRALYLVDRNDPVTEIVARKVIESQPGRHDGPEANSQAASAEVRYSCRRLVDVGFYAIALVLAIRFGSHHFRVPFSVSDAIRTTAACVPLVAFLQLEFQPATSGFFLMLGGGALVYAASALAFNVVYSRSYLMRWLGT